ncbi:MAG: alanine--tRNA ligase [Candidatus Adiutrix sp.]|jgi:alanyl-tRNA synthetase|nr:alanine--tRNA ligase [Candidatus Adiutrix sp.]
MKASDVRNKFLDFFSGQGHRKVASSSLAPQDDPTLLFTNAGMVQFKRIFTGEEKRDYNRATTAQKCVRAGGKHNDLENVGYTARHHTFFEMLGNFSFGDYFKEQAIAFAWELLTKSYLLPADRLYATVFQDDDEAFDLWGKVAGLPKNRIYRLGEKDNFWAMGDTGPCGPCSEILIDQGPHIGCGRPDCAPGCDCDRYLEIWNLVFMQFERSAGGDMKPLPKPSIDTGMGLERLAAVCQGVYSNFETDLFAPLIEKVAALTGLPYIYKKELKPGDEGFAVNVSTRVLADHARAVTFLIGDGVRPENLGRGYVLRRILRRAVRHGRKLGLMKPFLSELADVVIAGFKDLYPELADNGPYIRQIINAEEERFGETLGAGMGMLNEAISDLEKKKGRVIDGRLAFKLYDTYGFPLDLVADVAREHGLEVDVDRFDEAMGEQKTKSRASWKGGDRAADRVSLLVNELTAGGFSTAFTGYDALESGGREAVLLIKDGARVEAAQKGDEVIVVFEETPFYAFSGGQAGDAGEISFPAGLVDVADVQKAPGTNVFLHMGRVVEGEARAGEAADLKVDVKQRQATAANHSATHLLHKALRAVLGDHVRQAGSLVASDRLRFDFTNPAAVSREDIDRIERLVNEAIRRNYPVTTQVMSFEEAGRSGAVALFEERYGEKVRVVSMGDYSKELCGGTHVQATGRIGSFLIIGESSVAAGVRRFECLTGEGAVAYMQEQKRLLAEIAASLKARPEEAAERISKLQTRLKELEKGDRGGAADASVDDLVKNAALKDGFKLLAAEVAAADPKALRAVGDQLKDRLGKNAVIGLAAPSAEGKALILVMVGQELTGRFNAGELAAKMAAEVGGKGGGRPDMAQAGGPDAARIPAALAVFKLQVN